MYYCENQIDVRSMHSDAAGRMRLSQFFLHMQELGEDHAREMGVGREVLVADGMVWVLMGVHVKMERYPMIGDRLIARTFPHSVDGLFFPRYYVFYVDGEQVGAASTSWVLFNIERRHALRPRDIRHSYSVDDSVPAPLPLPGKLRMPDGLVPVETRRARNSDFDLNGHVNNSRYVDFVCDLLTHDEIMERPLHEFQIYYTHEVLPGQSVELSALRSDALYVRGTSAGKEVFTAKARF